MVGDASSDFPNPHPTCLPTGRPTLTGKNVKTVRSEQIRLLKFILNTMQYLKMQTANKAVLG